MRIRSLFLLVLLLTATACGGDDPDPRPSRQARPSPSPSPVPVICPLTGVEAAGGFEKDRPTLAVKIENSTKARPQAGLEHADVVFEELAEGGITRFLALFHCSDADTLGPIRSVRMVDPDIVREFSPALFAFSGGNPAVRDKIRATEGVTSVGRRDHAGPYRKEPGRPAPSDVFSSTQALRGVEAVRKVRGAPVPGWTYLRPAATPASTTKPTGSRGATGSPPAGSTSPSPAQGSPASTVRFDYSGNNNVVKFTHDAASNTYLRFHGETPHMSAAGKQFAASTVIVMKVKVTQGTISDARGNFSPEIEVVGEGEVTIVHSGRATIGKWRRPALSEKTQFLDGAGKPLPLLPGKTWIHLVPVGRSVTLS